MAKTRLILPFEALSGAIDKQDGVVFRCREGQVEAYRTRKRDYHRHPIRGREAESVERFKRAMEGWHRIRADPQGEEYQRLYREWKMQTRYKRFYQFVVGKFTAA